MILSDRDIQFELDSGNIFIDPFHKEQVQPNSYDFRLGSWYARARVLLDEYSFYDPYEDNCIWEDPVEATNGSIYIQKGEMILAHSQEVMGGIFGITTEMKTRSSMARIGISVCRCAGVGDVGYVNRWTMEITNHSPNEICLPVGCRIGQMLFIRTTSQPDKPYQGSYLQSENWSPFDMLPHFDKNKL